ncbi:MAG TPA: SGNH/GDSL hydrolase family protein [Polyangiaceae bacterium]|nr:SGNH/GDSL hydrolase family protein [Polyangiaceae bacterium]
MVECLSTIASPVALFSTAARFSRCLRRDCRAGVGWALTLTLTIVGCRRLEPSLYRPSPTPSGMGHVAAPPQTNPAPACDPQQVEVPAGKDADREENNSLVCGGDVPVSVSAGSGSPASLNAAAGANAIGAGGAQTAGNVTPLSALGGDEAAGASNGADPRAAAEGSALSRACHLLVVGDSLSDPKSGGGGYLLAVSQRCQCAITNIAKGGAMVNQMRAQLFEHLENAPDYSHAVVFGGVNDLYSDLTAKRTVAKIATDLEKMYRAMQQRRTKVIAITVTPWGGFRRYFTDHRWQNTLALNRWIRETRVHGMIDLVLDGEHLLACGDAERLCDAYAAPYRDGLHFGPLGHQRLAHELVQALGPAYCPVHPDHGSVQAAHGESATDERAR